MFIASYMLGLGVIWVRIQKLDRNSSTRDGIISGERWFILFCACVCVAVAPSFLPACFEFRYNAPFFSLWPTT